MILWTIQGQFCEQKRRGRLAPSFSVRDYSSGSASVTMMVRVLVLVLYPLRWQVSVMVVSPGGKALQFQFV